MGLYKDDLKYIMDIDMLFRLSNSGLVFKYVPYDLALFNLGGATGDVFYKKVVERYKVVRENGGSLLLSFYIASRCMVKDIIKLLVDKMFGEDYKNRILGRKKLS